MITERQKEFLTKIFEHYLKHKNPIHYTSVAQWLGVSKWTAYDMLKRLCRGGYLDLHYAVNKKGVPGRSLLFYVPTSRLEQLFEWGGDNRQEEWVAWKKILLSYIEGLKENGEHTLVEELVALLPETKGSVMYCACALALFVAYIKTVNARGMRLIHRAIDLVAKPEQRLSLFAGMTLGVLSKSSFGESPERTGLLVGFVDKYHRHLSRIDFKQHRLLVNFLGDLLQAVY